MKYDQVTAFENCLVGRSCVIRRRENDWTFDLSGGVGLGVNAAWRIICDGRIAFGSEDHGHRFGFPSAVDGEAEARKVIRNKAITAVKLNKETADLVMHFDASTRIDVFNDSMGYEGWQASFTDDGKRWLLIALGGGDVVFMAG